MTCPAYLYPKPHRPHPSGPARCDAIYFSSLVPVMWRSMMEAIDTPHLLYLLLSLRPVVAVVVGISEVDISVGRDPAVDAVIGLVGEVDAAVFGDSRAFGEGISGFDLL